MAHLCGATGYRVKHFQRRHQFARRIDLDLQATVAHFFNQFGEAFGAHAHTGEVLWPGRDHFPVEGLSARALLRLASGIRLLLATGQSRGCETDTGCCENLTTFHAKLLYCCSGLTTGSLQADRASLP